MIPSVRKVPVLRYGLVVLLIVMLFGTAFYLYLHYNNAEKLRRNFQTMVSARANSELIDSCILELYSADNNSRLYTLTGKKQYLNRFTQHIGNVHNIITVLNSNKDNGEEGEMDDLLDQKAKTTRNYIKLVSLTDSLTRTAGRTGLSAKASAKKMVKQPMVKQVTTKVTFDTIAPVVKQPEAAKKKFLGRLISEIAGKKKTDDQAAVPAPVIQRRTDTVITTTTTANASVSAVPSAYNNYYKKLYEANAKLRANERQMLSINNQLIAQIIGSLKKYKVSEQQYINSSSQNFNGTLTNVVYEFKRLSGLMFLLLTAVVVVILYNIWRIFRSESEMMVYTEKTENYANSKSRFMASMSHEIRTPLNAIIGFSEQLSQSELSYHQTEQVGAIVKSSKMLLEVVNEILDFSKYETGKMQFESEPFEPHEAILDVVGSMKVLAQRKGINLKHQISLNPQLCLNGDHFRLKQVIINLVGNAIKFTPHGSVSVKAFVTDGKPGYKILNVSVKDTGLGIEKENLPLIFEEFAQVASAQKVSNHGGTGLGLAICKKIIELQGGKIRVTSKPGKGSIFDFSLPMLIDEQAICAQTEDAQVIDVHEELKDRRILVAEDNKLNVLLVSTILKKYQIKFDIAYDGREALQLIDEKRYDAILTDIEMPEIGGIELAQLVRSNGNTYKAKTPILALTANVLKEDREKYLSVGMNGVVLKPFSEKNLINSIASVVIPDINELA